MTGAALAGLTVLEHPDSVAIRYCGKLLAAHGARVIQTAEPSQTGVVTAAQRARHSPPGRITAKHSNPHPSPAAPISLFRVMRHPVLLLEHCTSCSPGSIRAAVSALAWHRCADPGAVRCRLHRWPYRRSAAAAARSCAATDRRRDRLYRRAGGHRRSRQSEASK